jgi:hypothetical protein
MQIVNKKKSSKDVNYKIAKKKTRFSRETATKNRTRDACAV